MDERGGAEESQLVCHLSDGDTFSTTHQPSSTTMSTRSGTMATEYGVV